MQGFLITDNLKLNEEELIMLETRKGCFYIKIYNSSFRTLTLSLMKINPRISIPIISPIL